MRVSLGVCLVVLGAGCAHAPEKAQESTPATTSPRESPEQQAARARELLDQADKSYTALDFPACTEQFRQGAEASTDDSNRAEAFYDAAGCAALAGDAAKAIELLKLAVQHGYYDPDNMQYNPNLFSAHSHPGWAEVLAGAKANLAKAPHPPMPTPVIGGIDVYGSRRADTEAVRRMLGFEVGKPAVPSRAVFTQVKEKLRKEYNLAFADISFAYFYASEYQGQGYVTVDLVDAEDAGRLRFLPAPSGKPEDPEGLIAQWKAYQSKMEELIQKGGLAGGNEPKCRVAHCILMGFEHPELAPFEPVFVAKVPGALDTLTKVLREDASVENRAAAAFLLAYAPTPKQMVERLVPSIRDPDGIVRNNVLRVLTATQEAEARPIVDIAVVVDALTLPETSDRNKGTFLLEYLLKDMKPEELKAQRGLLIKQIGELLVTMAGFANPMNREPATNVLQILSGEKYEKQEQWKAWLARQKK